MNLIKPKKLSKGDSVAIVSLSWNGAVVYPKRYLYGINVLRDVFGLRIVEMPSVALGNDKLHKLPQVRAKDLMNAFLDQNVKAIISTIGGDDSIRMLPFIDFDVIKSNPKIFMGYSDTTVSHFMCLKAGLSSFYGPSVMSGFAENGGMTEYAIKSVLKTIFSNEIIGDILPSLCWSDEYLSWGIDDNLYIKRKRKVTNWKFLQGDYVVEGKLVGGCMEVLEMLKGTDLFPDIRDFEGAIIFFEVSNKSSIAPYLSYWLRNYGVLGILNVVSGIIFGRVEGGTESDLDNIDCIIKEVLFEFNCQDLPVITRMDFGHTDPMFVLPYGRLAKINPINRTFSILESAVI